MMSLAAAIIFAGVVSYTAIPIEMDPDIPIPIIFVMIPHEGISPEDSERLLLRPMELELRTLEGVKELNAYAAEGSGTIIVEFHSDFDQDQALIDVRESVDMAQSKLPSTAEEPIIREVSVADFPIITVSVGGEGVPDRVKYRLARQLKDEIETISDVLEARLVGEREELLEAVIDPSEMESYGITHEDLLSAVARNNRLIAAGSVDTGRGRFSVKIPSVIETGKDVLSIPVKATSEGVVTLKDVVTLRRTFKDATRYTRTNGKPAVVIEVSKRANTSIVDVVADIKAIVEEAKKDFPSNVEVTYVADMTPDTIDLISTLEGNISTAMFLVLTVVVATVGIRSGLLVALGIPFSFMFAFVVVNILGYTYNFMVMFGMLLGLGMLIDGAIVVVELADRRLKEGAAPKAAFAYAVNRMFLPILASTATTLAAFLPLMFWPGMSGQFMKYLPVTVFAVLVGSLAYALVFAPVLGAMISNKQTRVEGGLHQLVDQGRFGEVSGVVGLYAKVLRFSTAHPLFVIMATAALLSGILWLYEKAGNGSTFFIDVEPNFTGVNVAARGNYSAEELRDIVIDVEKRVLGVGHIESIYTRAGKGGLSFGKGGTTPDRIGSMFIKLTDRRTRDVDGWEVEQAMEDALQNIPGVRTEMNPMEMGPPVGKDIQIQLKGEDLEILTSHTRMIKQHLQEMEGLVGVDDTSPVPGIEWQIEVDRAKAAMSGADVSSVGAAIQLITNGVLVGKYRPDDVDDEVDIRVRYPEEYRGVSQLDSLRVSTRDGQVPISSFVERVARPKVSTIFRQDGWRVMYVKANAAKGVLPNDKIDEIRAWLATQTIDKSIKLEFRGANEEEEEVNRFIGVAFTLAMMVMGILLVTQFNSFYQALLILSAVGMSTVGVFLGLIITGYPFSAIMTGIGLVALAGIIVNNNIVLIDTYNYLRRENPGWDLQRVIMTTGCQRLRPVFLTTFTTGFGLLPLASGISIDLIGREVEVGGPTASYWVQLASAVVSGLTFATLLTLIVTPSLLIAPQAVRNLFRSLGSLRGAAVKSA
ncbi:MAG: efflux RND transporter permease subunit [Gammaproteobacteria bacterium]|jgi:multidrug efflux pump|nr:efflux RND transporter permease subunit [Gammaproteobacteria bacterium]MBT4492717.1 efflux RND transporter permease subunit [Gammaproteobacteria bacterium]